MIVKVISMSALALHPESMLHAVNRLQADSAVCCPALPMTRNLHLSASCVCITCMLLKAAWGVGPII